VIRHLQLDPHLPSPLLPADWPANDLRAAYRQHDTAFKHDLTDAGRTRLLEQRA
jgi:DNA-binding transcriptional regulator PaaX